MENASKAILIAGAILLVMAVIGVGMAIFSTTNKTIDDMGNDIEGFAVSAHNSKFNVYVGEVTGAQVVECIQKALSTNSNTDIDAKFKGITVSVQTAASAWSIYVASTTTSFTTPTNFNTNKKYIGIVTYDNKGIIKTIKFNYA